MIPQSIYLQRILSCTSQVVAWSNAKGILQRFLRSCMSSRVFHHFFKHFLAEPNRAYNFIAISVPQIQNFRKFGPKLRLLQAKNKLKQPNTANRPILAAPQPSRAELEHPQFWSDFSEILDLRS